MTTLRIATAAIALGCAPASAHDVWANGAPVPAWIKRACCGPSDAHHLRPDQVHRVSDEYYTVDGYYYQIPISDALPSEDGEYWIFYRTNKSGSQTGVFCFFAPMNF